MLSVPFLKESNIRIYVCIDVCIYTYSERKGERERERES